MGLVILHLSLCNKLIVMLGIRLGVNLEVKLGVGSKTGSKNSVLAFIKCIGRSVLAFLKCMDGSVLVSLKCMDGVVLAHLRFSIQSAPTWFPQSGNSGVPTIAIMQEKHQNVLFEIECCLHCSKTTASFPSTKPTVSLEHATHERLPVWNWRTSTSSVFLPKLEVSGTQHNFNVSNNIYFHNQETCFWSKFS